MVDFTRRWVFPVDRDANQLIDTFDKLKTALEPTSQYSDVAAAAVSREWDDRLISAALGTSSLGVEVIFQMLPSSAANSLETPEIR